MSVPDSLLDTSWSIQYVPHVQRTYTSIRSLIKRLKTPTKAVIELRDLSEECFNYQVSRSRTEPTDDLNDSAERTGQLRECIISPLHHDQWTQRLPREILGVSIQTRYQKTTYHVILLINQQAKQGQSPVSTLLCKGSQAHIKHVKDWLSFKFDLPHGEQLLLPPQVLLQICSSYVTTLCSSWTSGVDRTDALRQAILKQTIGSLKLTIVFAGAAANDVGLKLKSMEFDVPAETINALLDRAAHYNGDAGDGFLLGLEEALLEKTGLKMPLSGHQYQHSASGGTNADELPVSISRITCAAFAVSIEGKLKLASKPVGNAEVTGYEEATIRGAYAKMLELVCNEVEHVAAGEG